MNCAEIKKLFSPYLDGRVSGSEMRALTRHMQQCAACSREYAAMQRTQQLLASLGPKQAPADLALKLRVAISREAAQGRHPRFSCVKRFPRIMIDSPRAPPDAAPPGASLPDVRALSPGWLAVGLK